MAAMMGLQHALAMIGGLITPPLLVYRTTIPEVRLDLCFSLLFFLVFMSGSATRSRL